MRRALLLIIAACGSSHSTSDAGGDVALSDGASDALGANLGTVSGVVDATCPSGAPPNATCKKVTVSGCPQIENEPIDATVAIVPATGTARGTIVHFSGGGGEGFETTGAPAYATAGFLQVFVSWASDWEQTQSLGIKAAGCRPSTILAWAFAEPTLHAGSRTLGFCGQGFSGGSGQLGYALAHYGMSTYLDYVNELSGPPFARIDLGCDFSQPATAMVCGATDTMQLPAAKLNPWENTTTCGSTTPPQADVDKWKADSISIGGVYNYPNTDVEYYDCTNQSTAVTAMAQIYYQQVFTAEGNVSGLASYHCYTQADGCQGEGLGSGAGAAANAMIAGCIPRHQ
jgi:hypothetical protein